MRSLNYYNRQLLILSSVLSEYFRRPANWQKHAANRDNPFETPLSCGDISRAIGILLAVAGYDVSVVTIDGLNVKEFGAPDHQYLIVGSHPENKLIVDGSWKQFVLGEGLREGRDKAPNIIVAPIPGHNALAFEVILDTTINNLIPDGIDVDIEVPQFSQKYDGMWGNELQRSESQKIAASQAILRERLGRLWCKKISVACTSDTFSRSLLEGLQGKGDPSIVGLFRAMEGKLLERPLEGKV